MKENKKSPRAGSAWRVVSAVFLALLLVAEGLLLFQVWKLGMLPIKFLIPIFVIVLLIDIPIVIAMFPRTGRWQKHRGNGKRITAYVLSVAIAAGCFFGWKAVAKGDQTVDAITKVPTVAAQVGVYVLAENGAEKIEDAKDYTFAVTELRDKENTQAAIAAIEKVLGSKIKVVRYNSLDELAEALYSGNAQAMILNVAYAGLYADSDKYSDFTTRTKVIYKYNVEKMVETQKKPSGNKNEPAKPVESVEETPFIVYLSGSDTRSDTLTDSVSRSDVNILAVVNPETKQILLVNTPRDYYIFNPAYGVMDKLTHCGLDGMGNSMEALSALYGYPIDYNAQINFTGFETLIDSIGGIEIYSQGGDGVHLAPGTNYLDGAQALAFARDRYSYADGDNARGRHQMQVITAVVNKMASGSIITSYSSILDSLQGMFSTSMSSDVVRRLIKMQMNDMASWNIQSYAVTGYGGTDSTIGGMAYVMYPYDDTVAHASELIGKVLEGKTLTNADIAS